MNNYITIDGGTTNTRIRLVKDGKIVADSRISIGAKDNLHGNDIYKSKIADEIERILLNTGTSDSEIRAIIASGMLTSEAGLYTVPHIEAPVGLRELNSALRLADVNISTIPCYFIPGVKLIDEDPCRCDMMRGEESEFFGLAEQMEPSSICILPGSHTKHILSDEKKRITSFRTFLTGEMLATLSQNTILSSSVDISISEFDETNLLLGYDHAQRLGINRVLFQTRIMEKLFGKTPKELYSYFLGAVLYGDLSTLEGCGRMVYVGGKRQLRKSIIFLLKHRLSIPAVEISEQDSETAAVVGAIKIFEYKGED